MINDKSNKIAIYGYNFPFRQQIVGQAEGYNDNQATTGYFPYTIS
jgi:hypothetical protein